jgi:hypothetical protein
MSTSWDGNHRTMATILRHCEASHKSVLEVNYVLQNSGNLHLITSLSHLQTHANRDGSLNQAPVEDRRSPHRARARLSEAWSPCPLRAHPVRFLPPLIATSFPRAKFRARKQAILCRDLGNSSLKKTSAVLNLASCFQATNGRTIGSGV